MCSRKPGLSSSLTTPVRSWLRQASPVSNSFTEPRPKGGGFNTQSDELRLGLWVNFGDSVAASTRVHLPRLPRRDRNLGRPFSSMVLLTAACAGAFGKFAQERLPTMATSRIQSLNRGRLRCRHTERCLGCRFRRCHSYGRRAHPVATR